MEEQKKVNKAPKILVYLGRVIIGFGVFIILFSVCLFPFAFFSENGGFLEALGAFYDLAGFGLGVCAFGTAVSIGKRWHLFALLIFVFFGSFLIGLFSMVGRETNVGYYIWAIGMSLSAFILLIMYLNWEELQDG